MTGPARPLPARPPRYRAAVALHRLDNKAWGFESNCFVCEQANAGGMRIAFFADDEAGLVVADFILDDTFSGPPNYVHGGVILAVMDEAMAWATIALAGAFALTRTTTSTFHRPVLVGAPHRVEARVGPPAADAALETGAIVFDAERRPCAESSARFVPLDRNRAASAIGPVQGDDARFVKG